MVSGQGFENLDKNLIAYRKSKLLRLLVEKLEGQV